MFNALLSLDIGLPKYLLGEFVHYNILKPHSISHKITYVNSLAVGAIPRNSNIFYVTVKYFEIISNYSLLLHPNIAF